jgi:hypothetical protein
VATQPDDTLGDPFGVVLGPYFLPRLVAIGIAGQTIVATPSPWRVQNRERRQPCAMVGVASRMRLHILQLGISPYDNAAC